MDFWRNINKEFQDEAQKRAEAKLDIIIAEMDKEIQAQIEKDAVADEYEKNRIAFNLESERQLKDAAATNDFERRQLQLENQRQMELEQAEAVGGDVTKINEKYAMMQVALEKEVQRQKLSVISGFAGAIAGLFDENTIAAKVAAVAQATINTYLGATAAFAQTPGGIFIKSLAAGTAIATGLANLKQILKVKTKGGGGGGSISTPSGTPQVSPVISSDGGTVSRQITTGVDNSYNAFSRDNQSILVVDAVTAKQQGY